MYKQFLQVSQLYRALSLLGVVFYLPSASVSSVFMVLYICIYIFFKNWLHPLYLLVSWAWRNWPLSWLTRPGWLTIVLSVMRLLVRLYDMLGHTTRKSSLKWLIMCWVDIKPNYTLPFTGFSQTVSYHSGGMLVLSVPDYCLVFSFWRVSVFINVQLFDQTCKVKVYNL